MTLGQKIKKLRTEKSLTQKDLADKLHVTFQTVSKWENDENEPDIATIKELAKLFECSIDYLLSEDEEELVKEEVVDKSETPSEPVPAPTPIVTKTVIIHEHPLHVCERCKKDIPEDELEIHQEITRHGGRGHATEYRDAYYHKKCLKEELDERAAKKAKEKAIKTRKDKKKAFILGLVFGTIALGAFLGIFLGVPACRANIHPALAVLYSVLISYAIFADLYCIVSGSYIADVFLGVAGWSIKLPGIIFTWDLEGIAFLIVMKLFFAFLGFFFGIAVLMLAVGISAALASISFPFVLIHNTRTGYADSL